jgi:hypothetical protein
MGEYAMILAASVAMAAILSPRAGSASPHGTASKRSEVSQCEKWIESRSPVQHDLEGQLQVVSPGVACFDGRITKDSVKPVESWIAGLSPPAGPSTLVVYSGGGDGEAGIDLAEKLDSAGVRVLVDQLCASSCADYLFAGVPNRSVTDGSMILFHGGFSGRDRAAIDKIFDKVQQMKLVKASDFDARKKQAVDQLNSLEQRQDALYRRDGVDPAVVHRFDDLDMKNIPDAECDPTRDMPHDFIVFSDSQMRRLGLTVESGKPDTDPRQINRFAGSIGKKHEICSAPDSFFGDGKPAQPQRALHGG